MLTATLPAQADTQARTFSARLQIALAKAARASLPCNAHLQKSIPVLPAADLQEPEFLSDRPLFNSARRAVHFAVTRDGSPQRPFYASFLDKSTVIGLNSSGFSVLDAAAQAGIILAILVRNLGPTQTSAIVAATAPRTIPCTCDRECCSGQRVFRPWRYAIDYLTAASQGQCDGQGSLRRDLLVKIYDRGRLDAIARDYELEEAVVQERHRELLRWLRGAKGKRGEQGIEGLERAAWREAESVLRDHRIVA